MVKKILGNIYIYLILILMYVPILMIIAFSVSSSPVIGGDFGSFSFEWYQDLFSAKSTKVWVAVGNTLIIAITSSIVSVVLGTLGAIGTHHLKKGPKKIVELMTQIPVVNAEIVMALSLTIMFVFVGRYIFGRAKLFSYWTLLIGHVVLSIPFVYLSVKPKLQQMDPFLYEAALDLGCTPHQALWKATFPQIVPGILSGFLLSITLSLDDFIITAFTRGPGLLSGQSDIETLSTYIQAAIHKKAIPGSTRALTTIIFVTVLAVVVGITLFKYFKEKKTTKRRRAE